MAKEEGTPRAARIVGAKPSRREWEWQEQMVAQRAEFQRVVDDANATIQDLRAFLRDTEARLERAQEDIRAERRAREAAEAELQSLKKGAQNMIKYVSGLQRKKHEEELGSVQQQLESLRREVVQSKALVLQAHRAGAAPPPQEASGGGGRGPFRRRRGRV